VWVGWQALIDTEITVSNECSIDKVSADCKPIVQAALECYRRDLDKLLVSVRLLGSAARGEGVPGVSDIGFVGLVSMSPDAYQRDKMATDSKRLTRNHQCVSLVGLEIEIKGRVQPLREFIFQTDSVCIWGSDVYSATEKTMAKSSLAKLTTPDFSKLMSGYRQRLKGSLNGQELGQFGRSVGKEILRCFRKYLVLRLGVYRKSTTDIHNQLVTYFPDKSETFNCLLRLYEQAVERKEELLEILKMAQASHASFENASL
jgi:hypothetical protein